MQEQDVLPNEKDENFETQKVRNPPIVLLVDLGMRCLSYFFACIKSKKKLLFFFRLFAYLLGAKAKEGGRRELWRRDIEGGTSTFLLRRRKIEN